MKIKGVIEDLKIKKKLKKKKKKNDHKNSKDTLSRISPVLLWAVWGQFIFG